MLAPLRKPGSAAVVAHRGARLVEPENTPAAFAAAAAQGAHGVELDVRRSADGVLMVHHDATIAGVGPIVEHRAEELARLAPDVVDLEGALAACAGMWVNVEVKNSPTEPDWDPDDRAALTTCRLAAELGIIGSIVVSSFNPMTLVRVRRHEPGLATGWLVRGWRSGDAMLAAAELGLWALHPHHAMLAGAGAATAVRRAADLGVEILTWTVNDAAEARRLSDAGVFAVFTDDPATVARSLSGG